MKSTIVVSFRWAPSLDDPAQLLHQASKLAQRAGAFGASLCAFGGYELGFAFSMDDHHEAIQFAVQAILEHEAVDKAGIASGAVFPFEAETGSFVALAWGEPVVVAAALARSALSGEILVDALLPTVADGTLNVRASGRDLTIARQARPTFALDLACPFTADADGPTTDPHGGSTPDRKSSGSFEIVELAREALRRGDSRGLDAALEHLRGTGQHPDLVERLAAVLSMTRGAKEDGLRILRRAAENEPLERRRARAILAFAVGLAASGRTDDSLLEALTALALTRAHADRSGEIACTLFLAQLSSAAGHDEAARLWEEASRRPHLVA